MGRNQIGDPAPVDVVNPYAYLTQQLGVLKSRSTWKSPTSKPAGSLPPIVPHAGRSKGGTLMRVGADDDPVVAAIARDGFFLLMGGERIDDRAGAESMDGLAAPSPLSERKTGAPSVPMRLS